MIIEPVHKERGIMEIQKRFHIPDEDIVVFGDGMNDRTMFRKEWLRIAMGNAKPELKALASYITDRADEDGIYNACRHFVDLRRGYFTFSLLFLGDWICLFLPMTSFITLF